VLKASIEYGLTHRKEALKYAMGFGRGVDRKMADTSVGMYVNEFTRDLGRRGRHAIRVFLDEAARQKLIPAIK